MDNVFAIFIFSYNRGKYLENCVLSILTLMDDFPIYIVDDGSKEPYTQQVLNNLSVARNVTQLDLKKNKLVGEKIRGGLYYNMQNALEFARENGIKNVLFIQDDMQITRRVSTDEILLFNEFFKENAENCFMIKTCFLKKRFENRYKLNSSVYPQFYRVEKGVRIHFSVIGVFSVANFFKLKNKLEQSEDKNNSYCEANNIFMPLCKLPFMHWLPYPESYRFGRRGLKHRIIEKLGNAGFHPIKYMNEQDLSNFSSRDLSLQYPIAEDWLVAPVKHKVWSTTGEIGNLVSQGGWKKKAAKLFKRL